MKDILRAIFDSENIKSIRKLADLEHQTEIASNAIRSQPSVFESVTEVYKSAPYLLFVYLLIGGIDLQYRIIPTSGVLWRAIIMTIVLTLIANVLCYVEAHNRFVRHEEDRIQKPFWYALRKTPTFAGLLVANALLMMIGIMVLIVPGVYFAIRSSLSPAICIGENVGIRKSIKRSFERTKHEGEVPLMVGAVNMIGIVGFVSLLIMMSTKGIIYLLAATIFISIIPQILHTTIGVLYMRTVDGSKVEIEPRETPELLTIDKKTWKR